MIAVIHLPFFYKKDRIQYVNRLMAEYDQYPCQVDIFIHTNKFDLTKDFFVAYTNGLVEIVGHDIPDYMNPYFLTWKCRGFLVQQKDSYDVFMYSEDDMLIPRDTFQYWLENHTDLVEKGYNLGFLRIEIEPESQDEYITDLDDYLRTIISIDNKKYCLNNVSPYCAFWIYDHKEFNRWINSPFYDPMNIHIYGVPERSAVGLHSIHMNWYKGTVIPLENDYLTPRCKIYHLPNNFVVINDTWAKIRFKDALVTHQEKFRHPYKEYT